MFFIKRTHRNICKPLVWICWFVGRRLWKNFQSTRVLEGEIDEDQMNLSQPHGTLDFKKKVIADLRVKRPHSYRIQLWWGYINHSKLVFWFKNPDFQEKRPRNVVISKVPNKLKKICNILMTLRRYALFS